jgi:hypothetical protein
LYITTQAVKIAQVVFHHLIENLKGMKVQCVHKYKPQALKVMFTTDDVKIVKPPSLVARLMWFYGMSFFYTLKLICFYAKSILE